jgi:hypothetical protein
MGRQPGRQEARSEQRSAGHVEIERVVTAFQILAAQHGEIRHQSQSDAAGLDQDQRSLVLGIRIETAHGRRVRPIGAMREAELIGQLVQRHLAGWLKTRQDADPRALPNQAELAQDAMLADGKLLD